MRYNIDLSFKNYPWVLLEIDDLPSRVPLHPLDRLSLYTEAQPGWLDLWVGYCVNAVLIYRDLAGVLSTQMIYYIF